MKASTIRDSATYAALEPEELTVFARQVVARIADRVESYRALCAHAACSHSDDESHACIYEDIVRTNEENLRVYFAAMESGRIPGPGQLADLVEAARRRVHQGVPVEDVVRAYRVGVGAMLDCLLRIRPQLDVRDVAQLTVEYVDCVTTAAERAYVTERRQLVEPDDEASRVFLARLVAGEFVDDLEVQHEAASLGLDLSRAHLAVNVAPQFTGRAKRTDADRSLAIVAEELSRVVPHIRWALVPSGLYMFARDVSSSGVDAVVRSALTRRGVQESSLVAGVGGAHPGAAGLAKSVSEAERARTLGCILDPHGVTHRYEDVRYCDIFRSGAPLQEFVSAVVGPLVDHDHAKQGQLAQTLYEFFASGMSRKETALRLGIHPNTLDYRLRRSEEILGETALTPGLAFRFQLAFRLLPITGIARESG